MPGTSGETLSPTRTRRRSTVPAGNWRDHQCLGQPRTGVLQGGLGGIDIGLGAGAVLRARPCLDQRQALAQFPQPRTRDFEVARPSNPALHGRSRHLARAHLVGPPRARPGRAPLPLATQPPALHDAPLAASHCWFAGARRARWPDEPRRAPPARGSRGFRVSRAPARRGPHRPPRRLSSRSARRPPRQSRFPPRLAPHRPGPTTRAASAVAAVAVDARAAGTGSRAPRARTVAATVATPARIRTPREISLMTPTPPKCSARSERLRSRPATHPQSLPAGLHTGTCGCRASR